MIDFFCNFGVFRVKIWQSLFYTNFCIRVLRYYTPNFESFWAKLKVWRPFLLSCPKITFLTLWYYLHLSKWRQNLQNNVRFYEQIPIYIEEKIYSDNICGLLSKVDSLWFVSRVLSAAVCTSNLSPFSMQMYNPIHSAVTVNHRRQGTWIMSLINWIN